MELARGDPWGNKPLNAGFLRIAGPVTADFVLLLEMGMAVGLVAGTWFARTGRFRAHARCQSAIVLFNACVIALTMVPSFRMQVLPRIPLRLGKASVALATAHAVRGSIAELMALYILLAAGTSVLPERMRITRYKAWMRGVLVLWWLSLLLGLATYTRWYLPELWRK